MKVINLKVGYLATNCYIIVKEGNCLLIDPGDDWTIIRSRLNNYCLKGILITHYHDDHIGALRDLINNYKVNIYDYHMVNEEIIIDDFIFDIVDTSGHTSDSVSFYFKKENILFGGDFIFKGTIGRCDFANSSWKKMRESFMILKKMNQEMIIYPGHGDRTSLGEELKTNRYLIGGSDEE